MKRPALHTMMALLLGAGAALAQEPRRDTLPPVSISGRASEPVQKSYRRMLRGLDYFERERAAVAPNASLRFKLLPRQRGTEMDDIVLELIGRSFDYPLPIALDHSFELPRDERALREDALVSPNRKRLSMTWRTEIRTPGWPAGSRRLGDLRLECEVGLEAGLISNGGVIARIAELFQDSKRYCDRPDTQYLFFTERPLFGVTLVAGARRETLPVERLYARASDDPGLKDDLPFCDCEVLVDRSYFLPLGDHSWPDDTRVEFDYMDDEQ
ncbi:hypothetical protein [Roseateles violae]|uniref:Outer membrane lipoprotein-sorting protein n=1 Tax=Roseateles violae TaxID=3058042 RepID=A0ABT8DVR5_9BURK|nr:hypothetical protein [Pelomonas sp. PFR6]MDN3922360.1 hypothetical protein [Pelomonas sp. PFR6]